MLPPPARSVAWCSVALWLASLAMSAHPPSPLAPIRPSGAPQNYSFWRFLACSLLALCLIDITLNACRYAVFRIREKQRLHSLFSLMPNPASPRPPSLRSHGVGLLGSLLSPLRPTPSALAPAAPSGGSPILLFLALPCLLFACLILPLMLADMRSFAFGKNSGCTRCFPSCPIPHPPARPRFGRMVSGSSARFSRHSALPQAPLLPLPPRGAPYNYPFS